MKTENLKLLMKCFLNEGLVMFDKKTQQLKVKTPERNDYSWSGIKDESRL